jgi:hypothetical protein
MLGFRAAAEKEMIEPLLAKYGLTEIQPDQWYPLQTWLEVLSDIARQAGDYASMLTFVNIGQKVALNVRIPQELEELVKQIGIIEFMFRFGPSTYYRDHQGQVGTYTIEKINPKHIKCILNTPYPPDFWYGIISGFGRLYAPSFVAQYEDINMRHSESGQTIIIHLIVE